MKRLPIEKVEGKSYFVDLRLHQLRNIDNPHDFKTFRDEFDLLDYLSESGININPYIVQSIEC
jgi:hypothetical protein